MKEKIDLAGLRNSTHKSEFTKPCVRQLKDKEKLSLHLKEATVQVHPALGRSTPVWGYDGEYPGPTVVVEEGSSVQVEFVNEIHCYIPFEHVVVEDGVEGDTMNDAGCSHPSTTALDTREAAGVKDLKAWTVAHLHGASTKADHDGWTENMLGVGESANHFYDFSRENFCLQPADKVEHPIHFKSGATPTYWYHDHGMGVTRFNVYAGLAGLWLVRSPLEKKLNLPQNEFELPVLLQDRNFAADGDGKLSGPFLHKVEAGVREIFAPVTLVNGKVWPTADVAPRVYRLRLANGSNARFFRLHFIGDFPNGERRPLDPSWIVQIGIDGGLLRQAVSLPLLSLILAPGERADVLLDFGLAAQSGCTKVQVYNSAPAPFPGGPLSDQELTLAEILQEDRVNHRPYPEVMIFNLDNEAKPQPHLENVPIQSMELDQEFVRIPLDHHDLPSDHGHSLIVLREEDVYDSDAKESRGMLFLHEMKPESEAEAMGMNMYNVFVPAGNGMFVRSGVRIHLPGEKEPQVTVAKNFNDATTIQIPKGSWHLWKVLNLSPDSHPFHIHLVQFQAYSRKILTPNKLTDKGSSDFHFVEPPKSPQDTTPPKQLLDDNECGWKDTIRVNPGDRDDSDNVVTAEMVTVLAHFDRHAGRYMYHCHILEHEDSEMMRPFVVVPKETMPFMQSMGEMHH